MPFHHTPEEQARIRMLFAMKTPMQARINFAPHYWANLDEHAYKRHPVFDGRFDYRPLEPTASSALVPHGNTAGMEKLLRDVAD